MSLYRVGFLVATIGSTAAIAALAPAAAADNLYHNGRHANIASDIRSMDVGDILTVVVVQSAEARNSEDNFGKQSRSLTGQLSSQALTQSGQAGLSGDFGGHGEIRRSESLVTQISVTVESVEPNGDLIVAGEQHMKLNGEKTMIRVRGRVRPQDISAGNQVASTRLANAEIDYDGKGFVSRNAHSGPLGRIFSILGLGG